MSRSRNLSVTSPILYHHTAAPTSDQLTFDNLCSKQILTVAVSLVGEFDVIKRQLLALTNHTHHQRVTCLQRRQCPVNVLGVKLPHSTHTHTHTVTNARHTRWFRRSYRVVLNDRPRRLCYQYTAIRYDQSSLSLHH